MKDLKDHFIILKIDVSIISLMRIKSIVGVVFLLFILFLDDSYLIANQSISHRNCNDITVHFEYSHIHGSKDHILLFDLKSNSFRTLHVNGLFPTSSFHVQNKFLSNIWQPPKVY